MELIIGLAGVILGSFLSLFRESFIEWRKRKKDARFLAVRITCVLERFFDGCVAVALDNGRPDKEGVLYTVESIPILDIDIKDAHWQSLPFDIMYEILNFPSLVVDANGIIESIAEYVAHPPDYTDFFEERQLQYSILALEAFRITSTLRKQYGMPPRVFEHWNPVENVERKKQKIEELRASRPNKFWGQV